MAFSISFPWTVTCNGLSPPSAAGAAPPAISSSAAALTAVITGFRRQGLTDRQRPLLQDRPVELLDRLLRIGIGRHFYKGKSLGLTGHFVGDDLDGNNRSGFSKKGLKLLFRDLP